MRNKINFQEILNALFYENKTIEKICKLKRIEPLSKK